MAKIPDYASLSRAVPQVDGNIDTRGAGSNISTGLMDVAQASGDAYQRKTNLQLAKAKAKFSIDLIAEESALDKDPDYATYGDRFNKNIQSKVDEAAGMITDGAARNEFMNAISVPLAVTADKVRGEAADKESEYERGELTTTLDTMRDAAITSGDVAGFNAGASNYIDAAVDAGHVDYDDAEKLKLDYRNNLSVGYLSTLEPEQRLDAMKQVKPYLPADKYAEIERDAKNEVMKTRAQAFSQQAIDDDLTYEQAMDKAKGIKDPMERAITEQDTSAAYRQNEAINQAEQQDIMTTWYDLQTGTNGERVPASDLRKQYPEQWDRLTRAQKKAINAEEASLTTGKSVGYNDDAELRLNSLYKSGNKVAAYEYYLENRHALSDEQKKRWNDAVTSGLTPKAADLGDGIQYISKLNLEKEESNLLSQKYINWHNAQADPPSRAKTNEWIDGQLLEVTVPGAFFDSEVERYKLNDQQAHDMLVNTFGADIVSVAYDAMKAERIKPTTENTKRAISAILEFEEENKKTEAKKPKPLKVKIEAPVVEEDKSMAALQREYEKTSSVSMRKALEATEKTLATFKGSKIEVDALTEKRDYLKKALETIDTTQAETLEEAMAPTKTTIKEYVLMSKEEQSEFEEKIKTLYKDEYEKIEDDFIEQGINVPFQSIYFNMIKK